MAAAMDMDPASWQTLLRKLGSVIRDKLSRGEFVGIPGVGTFLVRHKYGRTVRGKVIPHLAVPKFVFTQSVRKLTFNAPNKGTPNELQQFKSRVVEAPSPHARRRSEFPGGYYIHGSGALAGIGQEGLGPRATRRRTTRAQTGFVERVRELDVKRRFNVAVKRAAIAAEQGAV